MGKRREQRTKIAIPVKVHTRDAENHPLSEIACTMDITPKGARLSGVRCAHEAGEILCIERGKNKAFYRVMWIGTPLDGRNGQVGLQCIEPDAAIWGIDVLGGEDERYETVRKTAGDEKSTRERNTRFQCPGIAQIFPDGRQVDAYFGELADLSATGCYIRMAAPLKSNTKVRMRLTVAAHQMEIIVKGLVGMSDRNIGMWVNFTEISQDDAPRLDQLLKRLAAAVTAPH